MPKRKKIAKKLTNPLDRFSQKRGRGRPPRLRPTEIRGRADNYRSILGQVWGRLWPRLSQARTDQEVIDSFLEGASPYAQEFVPALANLISRVLHERKFPNDRTRRSISWPIRWLGLIMFLHAVRAIFVKSSELEKNALTTSFAMSFISNVPAVLRDDPIITLVGNAARKLISGILIWDLGLKKRKVAFH